MLPQVVCMIVCMFTAMLICLLASTSFYALTLVVIVSVHACSVVCEMKRQMLKSQQRGMNSKSNAEIKTVVLTYLFGLRSVVLPFVSSYSKYVTTRKYKINTLEVPSRLVSCYPAMWIGLYASAEGNFDII